MDYKKNQITQAIENQEILKEQERDKLIKDLCDLFPSNENENEDWLSKIPDTEKYSPEKEQFLELETYKKAEQIRQDNYNQEAQDLRLSIRNVKSKRLETIKKWLMAEARKHNLEFPQNYNALLKCMTQLLKHARAGVNVTPATGIAFYTGLCHCNNVHCCPFCAARTNEIRRKEVALAVEVAKLIYKLQPALITLTFPHTRNQKLDHLLEKQTIALKHLRQSRTFKRLTKKYNYKGLIRSLEVNNGVNGWHPHTHELWFMDEVQKKDQEAFRLELVEAWEKSCIYAGLIPARRTVREKEAFRNISVHIHFKCSASTYITTAALNEADQEALAKQREENKGTHWGVDKELARKTTKQGRRTGKTIWQLIDDGRKDLFMEYLEAMKGKASIYFSPAIRKMIDEAAKKEEEEKTEEQKLAEKPVRIMWLERPDWKLIIEMKAQNKILWFAELPLPYDEIEQKILTYIERLKKIRQMRVEKWEKREAQKEQLKLAA